MKLVFMGPGFPMLFHSLHAIFGHVTCTSAPCFLEPGTARLWEQGVHNLFCKECEYSYKDLVSMNVAFNLALS